MSRRWHEPDTNPTYWEPLIREAEMRGKRLLGHLHEVVAEWERQVPGSAVIMDAWRVPLPGQRSRPGPGLRYQNPIERLDERIGVVVSDCDLQHILSHPKLDALILRLEMVLTELREWAEIEAERRGEKLRLVEDRGITPDVERLLTLCHFPIQDHPLEMQAYEVAATPFQRMDVLRRFIISRTWRYTGAFPWIAFTPNGVIRITTVASERSTREDAETMLRHWEELNPDTPIRVYRTMLADWTRLPEGLQEVYATMGFAESAGIEGLINDRIEGRWAYLFGGLPPERIDSVVRHILGPLMRPESKGLLDTLMSYLEHDQSIARTAEAMYVHPNTVLYRIRRVENLLGIDLRRTDNLTQVFLAVKLYQLFFH
ncbi:PucR family transcriptional regulator [Sulfobacillus harzensis]|uniref:PucR family transcriptional regulator n=1 Tax=Sulfobacillus harzensis TaxID=2729629 RepID=A0A7Y0L4J3_9FIRM|nr:helix-turn-helix domain-containing protein [Sulfobacillus harzensis]NMP22260.1 PucR family transcriptional regulator [Sulfobacillus harzensis]